MKKRKKRSVYKSKRAQVSDLSSNPQAPDVARDFLEYMTQHKVDSLSFRFYDGKSIMILSPADTGP